MKDMLAALAVGGALAWCVGAYSQEPEGKLTLRDRMDERGVSLSAGYVFDQFWNTRGGIATGDGFRGDLTIDLGVDTGKAGWWPNGEFGLQLQWGHGNFITEAKTGDYQTISNIDADDYAHVSQLWYKHTFLDGKLWLKGGKLDANEDFATTGYTDNFSIASAGLPPSVPLATWPDQDLGAVASYSPSERFTALLGVYQASPNGGRALGNLFEHPTGVMLLFEPQLNYDIEGHAGSLHLGLWRNAQDYVRFSEAPEPTTFDLLAATELFQSSIELGVASTYAAGLQAIVAEATTSYLKEQLLSKQNRDHSEGLYLTWSQEVYRENPGDEDDDQGLGIFLQGAWAGDHTQEVRRYFGGGFEWKGAMPSRDEDTLGLGIFHVEFNDDFDFATDSETAVELFYRAQLTERIALKPTLQYIVHPGGTEADAALVAGLRGEISL